MKKVVYYISEYGYGHAARSIAIIRQLIATNKEMHIQIVNQYAVDFIRRSLPKDRISFYELKTDLGYFLKEESIEIDTLRQTHEVKNYNSDMNQLKNEEINRLRCENIDLIISDIVPFAFKVADYLCIPSIGISNFTWYTAYQDFLPSENLTPFKDCYNKMDYFFALAGSKEPAWGRMGANRYSFYTRKTKLTEVNRIRSTIRSEKQLIFVGLGMKMQLSELQGLPIWSSPNTHFIVSSNLPLDHPNVSHIPDHYLETQNYIAACDLVITKAGWGTVSEAVVAGVPLLIIERDGMREDQNTIEYLKNYNLAQTIRWDDFKKLEIAEEIGLLNEGKRYNCVEDIVNEICRILE